MRDLLRKTLSSGLRVSRSRYGRFVWLAVTQPLAHRAPRTLNEKIRYKMRFDRSPLLQETADKVGLRRYVERKSFPVELPQVYAIWRNSGEVDVRSMPERCVLKPAHASGPVVVVTPLAPRRGISEGLRRQPAGRVLRDWRRSKEFVHPADLANEGLRRLVGQWLGWDYYEYRGRTEFCYAALERGVVVEELLTDQEQIADDVKAWCVDGDVRLLQLDSSRFDDHRQSLFTADGQPLAATLGITRSHESQIRLPLREAVLDVCRTLGAQFDFVRVDVFVLGDRIVLGELTHYPNGGTAPFEPSSIIDSMFTDWRPNIRYGPKNETAAHRP